MSKSLYSMMMMMSTMVVMVKKCVAHNNNNKNEHIVEYIWNSMIEFCVYVSACVNEWRADE